MEKVRIDSPRFGMGIATSTDEKELERCERCGMLEWPGLMHYLIGKPSMCDYCYDERYDD